jgi:flagellar motor switch protein FliM
LREKLKTGAPMGEGSENSGLFRRLQEPLMDIELEVQAVVDVVNISVGEIIGLRPDDILQLNTPRLERVEHGSKEDASLSRRVRRRTAIRFLLLLNRAANREYDARQRRGKNYGRNN